MLKSLGDIAIKGDGPRIAIAKPTMTEAAQELMRLLRIETERD
jgi:hypothetical protein